MIALRTIGYWRNAEHPEYPDPADLADESWSEDERDAVVWYLSSAFIPRTWMGYSPCRVCGRDNGAIDFTDGVYIWPEGLAHYVEEHAVRLPQEFVAHVIRETSKYDAMNQEDAWWLDSVGS